MRESAVSPLLATMAGLGYALLLGPVLVVFIIAFSADNFIVFPPTGLSLRWFGALFNHPALMRGLQFSLGVAVIVALLSLLLGVPAAYALARGQFRGRETLAALFLAPLMLPTLVLGLALLLAFQPLRLTATLPGLVLGHLCVTLPFVVRMVSTALANLPDDLEAAAATLGATPWRVVCRVTLPLAMPGLIAAAALSFLLSFDETVISLFISGPRASTLPVEMVRYVEGRTDPMVAALSLLLIAGTLVIVLIVERLVGLMRAVGK